MAHACMLARIPTGSDPPIALHLSALLGEARGTKVCSDSGPTPFTLPHTQAQGFLFLELKEALYFSPSSRRLAAVLHFVILPPQQKFYLRSLTLDNEGQKTLKTNFTSDYNTFLLSKIVGVKVN